MDTKYIISLIIAETLCVSLDAQDVKGKLTEAKSNYNSRELDDSRYALQQALSDINAIIGKEILAILPIKIDKLNSSTSEDQVTRMSASYTGLYVSRSYSGKDSISSATLQLVSDSPLLAGVNAILALPTFVTGSDANQKGVKWTGTNPF